MSRNTNKSRIACEERTRRTIEKYQGKLALLATWEKIDKEYASKLRNEATKLHACLVVKGVL